MFWNFFNPIDLNDFIFLGLGLAAGWFAHLARRPRVRF